MKRNLSVMLLIVLLVATFTPAFATTCPMSATGEHNWSEWYTTDVEANCMQSGILKRRCENCGAVEQKTVGKTEHTYGKWRIMKEPTCAENGKRTRKCEKCGYTDTEYTKKMPHSWSDWSVIVEPTDRSAGTRVRVCGECQETYSEDVYPNGTLKKGDTGESVKWLQELLNKNGYDCGKADGSFGQKTENAVKKAESDIGIDQDGIAWPLVIEYLEYSNIYLEKTVLFAPLNGEYYVQGEPVYFMLTLHNDSEETLENVKIYDPLNGIYNANDVVTCADTLESGSVLQMHFLYVVMQDDVIEGSISGSGMASWDGVDAIESESVTVKTGEPKQKKYFYLSDTANVREEYSNIFILNTLDDVPHTFCSPIEYGSDLGGIGLDCYGESGEKTYIMISGTPDKTGSGKCVYTAVVDDETWVIEIDITVTDCDASNAAAEAGQGGASKRSLKTQINDELMLDVRRLSSGSMYAGKNTDFAWSLENSCGEEISNITLHACYGFYSLEDISVETIPDGEYIGSTLNYEMNGQDYMFWWNMVSMKTFSPTFYATGTREDGSMGVVLQGKYFCTP